MKKYIKEMSNIFSAQFFPYWNKNGMDLNDVLIDLSSDEVTRDILISCINNFINDISNEGNIKSDIKSLDIEYDFNSLNLTEIEFLVLLKSYFNGNKAAFSHLKSPKKNL